MPKDTNKDMIHRFGYPVYATDFVGRNALVVAGGGGAAKTGVPNRIDVVNIQRDSRNRVSIAEVAGGLDTGTEAVMNLAVSNLSGSSSFFTSLEGHTCVEYFATLKASPSDDSGCSAPSPEHDHADHATDLQTNDVHTDPVIRKRKGSTRVSDTDENVSSANRIPPMKSIEANANELVQWNVEKLRQFTIPAPSSRSVVPRSPSNQPSGTPPARTNSSSLSGTPTCVTSGGPAGCWFAVGSDSGSVFLFDRIQFSETVTTNSGDSMKPFLVYPDVSVGLSTGVCALALTTTNSLSSGTFAADSSPPDASVYDTPLLATICEQPSWNLVHLWSVDNLQSAPHTVAPTEPSSPKRRQRKDRAHRRKPVSSPINNAHFFTALSADSEVVGTTQPYAVASYSHLSTGTTPSSSQKTAARPENAAPERSTYRFKHCQFLKTHLDFLSTYEVKKESAPGVSQPTCLLVTTMQPLCANRKSISRVIVWQVPIPARSSHHAGPKSDVAAPPLSLQPLTEAKLPQGDLPACLAVHPNRSRALIGVGTMEGRVEVYFLSPRTHTLTCVYSLKNAHPIFVTALTFLPVQGSNITLPKSSASSETSAAKADHLQTVQLEQFYELVSVSVDRMLRWHPGPSCAQISRLAHGDTADQVGVWAQGRRCLQTMLTYLALVFFIPILLALVDRMFHKEL